MRFLKTAFLDLALWTVFYPLRPLVTRLPPATDEVLGDLAAAALYRLKTADRERLVVLTRALLGGPEACSDARARDIAKKALRLWAKRHLELFCCDRMNEASIKKRVRFEGLSHIRDALALGRGAVLVTAHFGPFLLGPMAIGFQGFPITQLAGPQRPKRFTAIQNKVAEDRTRRFERLPLAFMELGGSLKPLMETLKRNELVVMAFDGRESAAFEETTFMGRKAHFSAGPFRVAEKAKAPLLPLFCFREADGRARIMIGPPVPPQKGPDGKLDAREAVTAFARLLEPHVAAHPDHFVMTLLNMDRDVRLGIVKTPIFDEDAPPAPDPSRDAAAVD